MKKKKGIDEQQEVKLLIKQFNLVKKEHLKCKKALSNAELELTLIKSINKHEGKTKTRPEEVYMINLKKSVTKSIQELTSIYIKKKERKVEKLQTYPKKNQSDNADGAASFEPQSI